MERLIDRRTFLQIFAGAGALAVSEVFVVRKAPTVDIIPPDIAVLLQEYSDRIINRIHFPRWEENDQLKVLRPHPEAFARATLLLAFYDGGENQLENAAKFLEERGLEVSVFSRDILTEEIGRFEPAKRLKTPRIELSLSNVIAKDTQTVDKTIIHELYHLIQQARDSEHYDSWRNTGTALTISATTLVSLPFLEKLPEILSGSPSTFKISRLGLLERVIPKVFAVILANQMDIKFSIVERQADFQAERLFRYAEFDDIRGKFFLPAA